MIDGRVIFDPHSSELVVNEKKIPLSFTESNTLELMLQNPGEVIDKERIKSYSWQGRIVTDSSIVKSISNLRFAFKEASLNDGGILTVPRMGYKFILSVTVVDNTLTPLNEVESFAASDAMLENVVIDDAEEISSVDDLCSLLINASKQPTVLTHIESNKLEKGKKFYQFGLKIKATLYILGSIFILFTIYNIFFKIDINLKKDFISNSFLLKSDNRGGKVIDVIYPKDRDVQNYFVEILDMAPNGSTVFINDKDGITNVGYLINKESISFTFHKSNYSKSLSFIQSRITEGCKVCVQ